MTRLDKWLIVLFVVVTILILFRCGLRIPAGAMSLTLFMAALVEHILRIRLLHKAGRAQGGKSSEKTLSVKEAQEMLGLADHYTQAQVKEAYHRLMKKIHPDQGGSKYMAAQLNQAKELLMKELKR